MQTFKVYSIRDQKGAAFHPPFYSKSHGEAERSFTQLVRDPKSTVSQFPDDFDLYYVGEFDDQTGVIKSLDTPQHLMKAVSVLRQ